MYGKIFFDLAKFKSKEAIAKKEKIIRALKIIPELTKSVERLGISGSFIQLNQIFDKKKEIDSPNKFKIVKNSIYEKFLLIFFNFVKLLLIKIAAAGVAGNQ